MKTKTEEANSEKEKLPEVEKAEVKSEESVEVSAEPVEVSEGSVKVEEKVESEDPVKVSEGSVEVSEDLTKEVEEKVESEEEPTEEAEEKVESEEPAKIKEKAPKRKKGKAGKEDVTGILERVYTIPFDRVRNVPKTQRARRAIKTIRKFVKRHMKSDNIWIDNRVNALIWARGAEKPPARIKVKTTKFDDGLVEVVPLEE